MNHHLVLNALHVNILIAMNHTHHHHHKITEWIYWPLWLVARITLPFNMNPSGNWTSKWKLCGQCDRRYTRICLSLTIICFFFYIVYVSKLVVNICRRYFSMNVLSVILLLSQSIGCEPKQKKNPFLTHRHAIHFSIGFYSDA